MNEKAGREAGFCVTGTTSDVRLAHHLSSVILGLDPRIHATNAVAAAWILGSSPRMTTERVVCHR